MSQGYLVTLGKASFADDVFVSNPAVTLSINIGRTLNRSRQIADFQDRHATQKPQVASLSDMASGIQEVMEYLRKQATRESKQGPHFQENKAVCHDLRSLADDITPARANVISLRQNRHITTKNCAPLRHRRTPDGDAPSISFPVHPFREPPAKAGSQLSPDVFGVES